MRSTEIVWRSMVGAVRLVGQLAQLRVALALGHRPRIRELLAQLVDDHPHVASGDAGYRSPDWVYGDLSWSPPE
jgi:hypothetical protein